MTFVNNESYDIMKASKNLSSSINLFDIFLQFPMVFQGWQTLVGFIVLRLLAYVPNSSQPTLTVISIDKSGFISL